jgi:hypothetical protein
MDRKPKPKPKPRPRPKGLPALVLAAGLVLWAGPSDATLQIAASIDGGGTIFAIDNDVTSTCASPAVGPCQLPDSDPALGSLVLAPASAGGGDLDVQASVQTADVGLLNRLDSTGTQFTNTGAVAHTFTVAIGATSFTGPAVVAFTTGAAQWSHLGEGFDGSVITMRWYDDPANMQGAISPGALQPGTLLDTFVDVAGPTNPDSFSHNGGPFAVADPALFSMTLQFDGTIGPGVRLTGRELTEVKPQAIPQPGALLLLGLGALVGAAARARARV